MILGVIPARYASARFPGKPLIDLKGKPMIQRVWEQAKKAKSLDQLAVATDDLRIKKVVESFGGLALMTPASCPSGTDRIAAALKKLKSRPSVVVNIQGDEPLLPPAMVDLLVRTLKDSGAPMATLSRPIRSAADYQNPNCVKVVCDRRGNALYFSRSPLPHFREGFREAALHVGLYAYKTDFLKGLARLKPTPLEKAEKLEQLRVLEHGFRISVGSTRLFSHAIDTPEDARAVRRLIK